MRYTMKNEGFPYKLIYKSRAKVGRVYRHADGHFVGMIGPLNRAGATEREAFEAVVAADCGHTDVEELRAHNSAVRAANRQRRDEAYARAMQDPMFRDIMELITKLSGALR